MKHALYRSEIRENRMSDHSGPLHCQGDQRAGQSVRSYQSVWMAHWTRTSCSAAPQVQNGPPHSLLSNGDGDAKKFTEVTDTRSIRMMNKGVAVTERLDCQPFPSFNVYQNVGCGLESNNVLDDLPHRQVSGQFDFKIENSGSTSVRHFNTVLEMVSHLSRPREHFFQSERISQCLEEPATQMIPCGSDKGKAPQLSFVGRQEKVKQIILNAASNEYLSNTSFIDTKRECNPDLGKFSILDRDKYWDDHSTLGKFGTSVIRQSDACSSLCDLSAGNNQLLLAGEPSNAACPFQRMRRSLCDMKTMGIVTANSVGVLAGGPAKFSQTNRNMLFVKNPDTNKSKQKQGLEESSDSMKSNRNMFDKLLSLSPPLCLGQRGVNIQLLDSSSDSQEKDNVVGILNPGVCQKNESSAETATMDMDISEAPNNLSGVNSSTSKKENFLVGHDPSSQTTTVSFRKEVECQQSLASLPDMNEIPVLQASSNSTDNAEPSASRTQSLDARLVLSHSEQPINHKTSRFPNSPPALEPSSRWLKRLKLGVSHSFGVGTKSLNVEEALSHQKVNELFSEVMGGNKTFISDQGFYKYDGKEPNPANQSATLQQKVESSSVHQPNKDLDILLSHSWIRRWCRAATQKKKLDAVVAYEPQSSKVDFDERQNKQFPCMGAMERGSVVVCKPQSTKVDFDELQNKQFPSMGAMALMGKAICRFQPCEFRNKGSFVVWDT